MRLNSSNLGFSDFEKPCCQCLDFILIPEAVTSSILSTIALEFTTSFCSGFFSLFPFKKSASYSSDLSVL